MPVVPDVKAMWPGSDGEGTGRERGAEKCARRGEMIEKGGNGLIVKTRIEEDAAHARAIGAVAGDAMMMRTLADVHMSIRRATGISGSAAEEWKSGEESEMSGK